MGSPRLRRLIEPQEQQLIKRVSAFPEIVRQCAVQRAPHTMVHYLRDLANDFHTNYSAHQFIVDDAGLRDARLDLALAAQTVIRNGLELLGVSAPVRCNAAMARNSARDYKPKRGRTNGIFRMDGRACGLALGLAVAAVVYIKDHRPDAPDRKERAKWTRKSPTATSPSTQKPGIPAPRIRRSPMPSTTCCRNSRWWSRRRTKDVRPDTKSVPETRRGTYVLQAGSYKNFADADRVRAQLALQGVESKVQKVTVDNDTWHRIRIGPISKLDELNRLRQILRKSDVDVLVIRVGD